MRRLQLFELEDLPWFPAPVRDAGTDFLRFMLTVGDNYAPVAPLLARALRDSGAPRVVDLCAGGGGPWRRMLPALAAEGLTCDVLLTDRFPNPASVDGLLAELGHTGRLSYHRQPVDALAVPAELAGFRTLFSALHHFAPPAATALLRDAVLQGAPIGVFESTQRNATSIVAVLFAPLLMLLVTPLIQPFRWSRLLLTYLVPLVPLMVLWDGLVSCLRSYTVAELEALVAGIPEAESYVWQVGEIAGRGPIPVTYLIGVPKGGAQ